MISRFDGSLFRRRLESGSASGERYRFGDNWRRYLELIDDKRIDDAEKSLCQMLDRQCLHGATFLDVGSGSGLSSLAARRLGAHVISFDYDPESVRCTAELKRRHFANDSHWSVRSGSILDCEFMATLPEADIVYSWGVLHHTGSMFEAIRNAAGKVRPRGLFFLALYRKTLFCRLWKVEKRFYTGASQRVRALIRAAWIGKTRLSFLVKGRDFNAMIANYGHVGGRGMDYYRDLDDWLGGYPYESITPPQCRAFLNGLGFSLAKECVATQGVAIAIKSGCDEWLFQRDG